MATKKSTRQKGTEIEPRLVPLAQSGAEKNNVMDASAVPTSRQNDLLKVFKRLPVLYITADNRVFTDPSNPQAKGAVRFENPYFKNKD